MKPYASRLKPKHFAMTTNGRNGVIEDLKNDGKYWSRLEKRMWMVTLFWSCMALYMVRVSMPLTITAVAKEFHWTRTQSGAVLSSFFWGYTLTQVLGGYLSDRIGGAFVLFCATIGWSMLTCWTPYMLTFLRGTTVAHGMLVLSRVLLGACQGVHFPAVTSLCSRNLPENERTFFFSTVGSGANMGTLLIGYVGSLLLDRFGWPPVFYFTGFVGFSWVVFLHYHVLRKKEPVAVLLESARLNDNNHFTTITKVPIPWLILLRKPSFWAMVVGHVCETNSWHVLISWLPTYFQEQYPSAKSWVYNVLPWMACVILNIAGGWIAEYLIVKGFSVTCVRKCMQASSQFSKALFLVLAGTSQDFFTSVTFLTLAVAVSGLHSSGILANPQDLAPRHAGAVFGFMNMAGSIPGFIGVYVASYVLATTNSWAAVFNLTAIINVIGGLLYILYGSGKPII